MSSVHFSIAIFYRLAGRVIILRERMFSGPTVHIEYGFTSPGELKPVENSADKFTFTDPDDGLIKITFEKDAEGQYTKCRLVAESLNLNVVGTKQK